LGEIFSPFSYAGDGMSVEILREGRVYLEYGGSFYLLHTTSDVTFSQTFKQDGTQQRSLHKLNNLFEGSSITSANPADFSFTMYLIKGDSPRYQHLPLDLLLNYNGNLLNTFNLYFVYTNYNPDIYYKLEGCVFTSGSFNIPRAGLITVAVSGQAIKLSRFNTTFTGSAGVNYKTAPTLAVSRHTNVTVGGNPLANILGVSLEVQNNITWTENVTLQKSLVVTSPSNTVFPATFTLESRVVGGSIQQYVDESYTQSKTNVQTWKELTSVVIQVGNSSTDYQLQVNMPSACSFTNRVAFGDIFTQSYDYRLMTNPVSLTSYFTY
jgi:hypothetical protein